MAAETVVPLELNRFTLKKLKIKHRQESKNSEISDT
jgi:hypothetical protein